MAVTENDVKFRKSEIISDVSGNGGRRGNIEVISGVRHNLFPRVTKAERTTGLTRFRKQFFCNEQPDENTAYGVMLYLETPSNAGDRFYLGKGTQTDVQGDLSSYDPIMVGVGGLNTDVNPGDTTIVVDMESNDFEWPNGGYLHITNKFLSAQTINSNVNIGDSVEYVGSTWNKISPTTDINYPNGLYIGGNTVMTIHNNVYEEWLQLNDNLTIGEIIGTGTGATPNITLSTLANSTNGICRQPGKLPVVTATIGGVTKTVNIASDGTCSGDCTGGQLNMADGTWISPIVWVGNPDNGSNILIDYHENCFSYSGNVATITTIDSALHNYSSGNTYVGGCIEGGDIVAYFDNMVKNTASGTFNEVTPGNFIIHNDGVVEDSWTITITGGGTTFMVSGANTGSVISGTIGVTYAPVNPNTGQPYFTINNSAWGGSWIDGETITFQTHPGVVPIWLKEIVPPGTLQEPNNLIVLGWYFE